MWASRWRSTSTLKRLLVSDTKNTNHYLELQHAFKLYDTDKNGTMDATEFKTVLKDLGKRDVTDEQVKGLLAEVDKNNDSVINWNEFLEVSTLLLFLKLMM